MEPGEIVDLAAKAESLGIVGILICLLILCLFVLWFLVRHYVRSYKELGGRYDGCQKRVQRLELAIVDLAASEDIETVRRKAQNIVENLSRR